MMKEAAPVEEHTIFPWIHAVEPFKPLRRLVKCKAWSLEM
jgi:hypothetical protein